MIKFVSRDKKTARFLRMAQLLSFLETSDNKADKVLEIKAAREDGAITEDEALELTIEFC